MLLNSLKSSAKRQTCEALGRSFVARNARLLVPAALLGGIAIGYWRACQRRNCYARQMDEAVDQAVLDSFPASDPPAFAGGSTRVF
jgi:hypothetical protein